ncbi:unnamed protein product [Parajaminaea phylloscopi]
MTALEMQGALPPATAGANAATTSSLIDPVPLSMPSILVNPKSSNPHPPRVSSNGPYTRGPQSKAPSKERHIGRRKLLRRVNAAMAVHNPHIARPRPADFQPGSASHQRYQGTFPSPLPRYLKEVGKGGEIRDGREARDWRKEMEFVTTPYAPSRRSLQPGDRGFASPSGDAATQQALPESGLFTMGLSEAKYFLSRRADVVTRLDRQRQSSLAPSSPMQRLVDCVEEEFASWQRQVVYLDPSTAAHGGSMTELSSCPRVLLTADDVSTSDAGSGRIEEHHRLPQSLSYLIPDAFDRLTVHCLARIWGLRSFSKAVRAGNGQEVKLTWILKPPRSAKSAHALRQRLPASSGRHNPFLVESAESATTAPAAVRRAASGQVVTSAGEISAQPPRARPTGIAVGFETPPTTDVGTSASEFGDSELDDGDDAASSVADHDRTLGDETFGRANETFLTAVQEAGEEEALPAAEDSEAFHRRLADLSLEFEDAGEGYEHSGGEEDSFDGDGAEEDVASSLGDQHEDGLLR